MLSDPEPGSPRPLDFASGSALIEEGSAIFEESGDPWGLGWVYMAKSRLALKKKDYAAQKTLLEKSKACFEQAGDMITRESINHSLFYCSFELGDYETARRVVEQMMEFYRKVNYKIFMAFSLAHLGEVAFYQEDFGRAETCFQEAVDILHEMGSFGSMTVWVSRMLGCCVARQGDIERAAQLLLNSQVLGRKLPNGDQFGDPGGNLAFVLWMGTIVESRGQPAPSARFLGAVEAVLETFFKPLDLMDQIEYQRITGKVRAEMDEAAFAAAWTEGRKLNLDQVLEEALAFCRE